MVVAYEILVSAQGPLVLGFWILGLRVWGLGLTIFVTITVTVALGSGPSVISIFKTGSMHWLVMVIIKRSFEMM